MSKREANGVKVPKSVIVSIYADGVIGCVWETMRKAKLYSDAPRQVRYVLPTPHRLADRGVEKLKEAVVKAAMKANPHKAGGPEYWNLADLKERASEKPTDAEDAVTIACARLELHLRSTASAMRGKRGRNA